MENKDVQCSGMLSNDKSLALFSALKAPWCGARELLSTRNDRCVTYKLLLKLEATEIIPRESGCKILRKDVKIGSDFNSGYGKTPPHAFFKSCPFIKWMLNLSSLNHEALFKQGKDQKLSLGTVWSLLLGDLFRHFEDHGLLN